MNTHKHQPLPTLVPWDSFERAKRAMTTPAKAKFQESLRYSPCMDKQASADTYNALYYSITAVFG